MSKKVELSIIGILFIFAFYCALIIGIPWDEGFEMMRGKERLKYLISLGSFKSYWNYQSEEFNPGFYSTLAIFITNMFPKKFESDVFHLTNSLFSILTVFGIYRISSILFNKNVGKITFLLCFLNPIFFGHMAMNSKDTIVAFANVWSTYIFLRYLQNQSKNCNRYILLAGLTIGIGTGVRIPFIITLIPLFFFAIIDIFFLKKITNLNFSFKKFVIHLIPVLFIAYLITISCWPQVHENIFTKPFEIASNIGNTKTHIFGLPWMLFNGDFISTNQPPNSYIIVNFFYKSPEFILFCYVIFIYFIITNKKFFLSEFKFFLNKILLILFIFLFPTIYLIFLPYKVYDGLRLFLYLIPYFNIIPGLAIYYLIYKSNSLIPKLLSGVTAGLFLYYVFIFIPYRVYDGLRIFLYIIPYFSIIPALTIYYLINNFNRLMPKLLLGAITSLIIYYLFIFFSFTPYQYTYLNKFVGNLSNAHKKFENDYWATSTKELINKIPNETNFILNKTKIKIAFCGVPHNLGKRELNKLNNLSYEQKNLYAKDVDYIIMTNRAEQDIDNNTLANTKTCFEKFRGEDLVSVKRNGLMLSTIRKLK